MAVHKLDTLGLKCPQPILKVVALLPQLSPGDTLEIEADCPSFPSDIKAWCGRMGKTLLMCTTDGNGKHSAQIQI